MKSNLSVGPPVDIMVYEKDSLRVTQRIRLHEGDAYLKDIREHWSRGLIELLKTMPEVEFPRQNAEADMQPDNT